VKSLRMLAVLFALAVVPCGPLAQAQGGDKLKIGFSAEAMKGERWQTDVDSFKARAEQLGAEVITSGNTQHDRESTCDRIQKETGATLIPPYDFGNVIAGQGTIGLEFLEQVPHLDAIVVPVGGGGMLSGVSLAAKAIKPDIFVFGAEPLEADDAIRSLQSGQIEPHRNVPPKTIADGLKTCLGELTFPIIQKNVTGIYTVTEDEIYVAMRWVWQRMKLLIEPSAAVGVAVVLSDKWQAERKDLKHVGIILCGGNVDFDVFKFPEFTRLITANSYQTPDKSNH